VVRPRLLIAVTCYTGYVATGQWFVDGKGTRWFFDSGALSLDFGYTGDYGYGIPAWEQMHSGDDLAGWLTGRFGALRAAVTAAEFAKALRLRAAITSVARAVADGLQPGPADVDLINGVAATADIAPVLAGGTGGPQRASVARALSTIARDAIATFGSGPGRVRRCGADNCALIFLDTSRPNSRRWCSMQRCGNRTKLRIHRNRTKEDTP
jgi:predicted RNA-binding Zn ribbon-like protein